MRYPEILILEDGRFGLVLYEAIRQAIDTAWQAAGYALPAMKLGGVVVRAQDVRSKLERGATPLPDGGYAPLFAGVSVDHNVFGAETGVALAASLRDRYPLLPLVLFTGNLQSAQSTPGYRPGLFQAIVTKPITPADYAEVWVDLLRERNLLPPRA